MTNIAQRQICETTDLAYFGTHPGAAKPGRWLACEPCKLARPQTHMAWRYWVVHPHPTPLRHTKAEAGQSGSSARRESMVREGQRGRGGRDGWAGAVGVEQPCSAAPRQRPRPRRPRASPCTLARPPSCSLIPSWGWAALQLVTQPTGSAEIVSNNEYQNSCKGMGVRLCRTGALGSHNTFCALLTVWVCVSILMINTACVSFVLL